MRCFLQTIHKVAKFLREIIYSVLLVSFCSWIIYCVQAAKLFQFATDLLFFLPAIQLLAIYEQIDIIVKEFARAHKTGVNRNDALFIIKHFSYFS